MNFLYDDIVHALQNTIDWCINSDTDRRGYVLERNATAITPFKVIQGHRIWYQSKAHFLLVINTNLPPILHRFQVMADYWSNFR